MERWRENYDNWKTRAPEDDAPEEHEPELPWFEEEKAEEERYDKSKAWNT